MPHTMVTFRLHRSGVILLIVFLVVLAILIYVAGYLTATFTQKERRADVSPPPQATTAPGGRAEARPTLPPPTPTPKESLTLRVAVLTSEEEAKAQVASLAAMGLQPSVVQMPTSSGVTLHTVVVGRYETRAAANAGAQELQNRLGFLPVVIPAQAPTSSP